MKELICARCGETFLGDRRRQHCAGCKSNQGNFTATSQDDPDWPPGHKVCDIEGCPKPSARMASQYCRMHYSRMRRRGSAGDAAPTVRYSTEGECRVHGCDKPINSFRLCHKHLARLRRHGDPEKVILPEERAVRLGPEHHNWQGDDIGYGAAHTRVEAVHGLASSHSCVDCGERAYHWSYDHKDSCEKLHEYLPGLFAAYSTRIDHYQARCVPCHKRFDLAHINSTQA